MALTRHFTPANRDASNIWLVVLHSSEGGGTAKELGAYFQTTDREVSYHFGIDEAGRVEEYVHPSDISWGAGNWSVNQRAINIGLIGYGAKNAFTMAQHVSLIKLLARLSHEYDLSLKRVANYFDGRVSMSYGVLQHRNVVGADHTDIGPNFPLRRLCIEARDLRTKTWGPVGAESG